MIYKKKYIDKTNIKYLKHHKFLIYNKLLLSFKKNYTQQYKKRISFFIQKFYTTNDSKFYMSQNKLYCGLTYSGRVPSHKLRLSRFYLVKHSDGLLLGGYQK